MTEIGSAERAGRHGAGVPRLGYGEVGLQPTARQGNFVCGWESHWQPVSVTSTISSSPRQPLNSTALMLGSSVKTLPASSGMRGVWP